MAKRRGTQNEPPGRLTIECGPKIAKHRFLQPSYGLFRAVSLREQIQVDAFSDVLAWTGTIKIGPERHFIPAMGTG